MLDKKLLKECIEEANYKMIGYHEHAKAFKIGPVRGHITKISSPWTNFVNIHPVHAPVDDKIIDDVIALFRKHNLAFTWLVGEDNDSRMELALIDKGFTEIEKVDGLAFDLSKEIPKAPCAATITIAEKKDQEIINRLGVQAYGLSTDVSAFYGELYQPGKLPGFKTYLAYDEMDAHPISYAAMMYFPKKPVGILCGAGTMPDYRGQGVYKALLAKRLLDAKNDGKQAIFMQAISSTSSPICQRFGFKKVYQQKLFSWSPHNAKN